MTIAQLAKAIDTDPVVALIDGDPEDRLVITDVEETHEGRYRMTYRYEGPGQQERVEEFDDDTTLTVFTPLAVVR